MASICPVCNGLKEVYVHCEKCRQLLVDAGRIGDQLDPYSPYINLDGRNEYVHECYHYLVCPNCENSTNLLIKEWEM